MTAPDSRVTVGHNDDGTLDEVVGTGDFHLEQMDTNAWWMQLGPHMVWLRARGKITAHFGENEALARGPQTPNGNNGAQSGREGANVPERDSLGTQQAGGADRRNMPDGTTFEQYRDALAVGNLTPLDQMGFDNLLDDELERLQAEVARLLGQNERLASAVRDTITRAETAEAKMAEVWADARQLAASVHGAFGALGSDPPEPILKLANRYFLMKRRGRRSAALNGGQDDA